MWQRPSAFVKCVSSDFDYDLDIGRTGVVCKLEHEKVQNDWNGEISPPPPMISHWVPLLPDKNILLSSNSDL